MNFMESTTIARRAEVGNIKKVTWSNSVGGTRMGQRNAIHDVTERVPLAVMRRGRLGGVYEVVGTI